MSPEIATDLAALKSAAADCTRCPLYKNATQVVFGEGPVPAAMMLVGEQPGDKEDLAGRPFVGPAGAILDRALEGAAIERKSVYLTNAVKHFKNEPRGKRRLHKRPNQYEIGRCRWWLDAELDLVRPRYIVALGATAALALTGVTTRIGEMHGKPMSFGNIAGTVTMHPSAILRMRDPGEREKAFDELVNDLAKARAA
ncbi:MAG TPA: UdgX family uracil-DNA binding protein, partial [Candidatus Didemnitutus sp.]|nr:UdgX family uracil-DNA binding protein [Candidatus Didemnitutus sp.]